MRPQAILLTRVVCAALGEVNRIEQKIIQKQESVPMPLDQAQAIALYNISTNKLRQEL